MAHELKHASDHDKGIMDNCTLDKSSGYPNNSEKGAVDAENRMRKANGDKLRPDYFSPPPYQSAIP